MASRWLPAVTQVTGAIGHRPDDRRQARREGPQAEELGELRHRHQPTISAPQDWLQPMHRPARIAATQNSAATGGRQGRQRHHHDPAHQRERERRAVADAVLHMAPGERADGRGDVDQEDQHHGLGLAETHRLLGIDRGQRDHHRDAGLVGAGRRPAAALKSRNCRACRQVRASRDSAAPISPRPAPWAAACGCGTARSCSSTKVGDRGQRVHHRGDGHGHRHELRRRSPRACADSTQARLRPSVSMPPR